MPIIKIEIVLNEEQEHSWRWDVDAYVHRAVKALRAEFNGIRDARVIDDIVGHRPTD